MIIYSVMPLLQDNLQRCCCSCQYNNMLLETALGKAAFGKIHIVQERKKPEAKKKVEKNRNISESISVLEIKMHVHYLGTDSLKFQFNF